MSDLAHPPQPKPTQAEADEFMADALGFGDGDDGAPAWVPLNARIHVDFLGGTPQGRAWVDGTGDVALTSILGADAVFTGSVYNPANIMVSGYNINSLSESVAFIGVALTAILGSLTLRIVIKNINNAGAANTILDLRPTNRADYIRCYTNYTPGTLVAESASDLFESIPGLVKPAGSVNVVALTIAGTRYEMAFNGSSPVAATLTADDRPAGNPFAHAMTAPVYYAIQAVTFYDPLPTTAGLSALSAIP